MSNKMYKKDVLCSCVVYSTKIEVIVFDIAVYILVLHEV